MNIVDLLEKPMLATCAAKTSISTHHVTNISTNAHVANVTRPVMVPSATIHSAHHPDTTKTNK